MRKNRSRFVSAVITLVMAAATAVVAPTVSTADTELLSCTGTGTNTYQPGVTLQPRTVAVSSSAHYEPCVSTGSPAITSGGYQANATSVVSCLAGSFAITVTITWNTGETTTVTAIGIIAQRPANEVVVVYQGTVTAGRFTGATVVMTAALLNTTPAQCLTPQGVTATNGPATIVITQLT
ncbi:hypothetical protein [Actinophytocola algeriensis]|uniref:Ig-like domain-containing protein n=1 Tax=Actinophytocola algeriensis TaxID=1768010 RepID=A0A7W7VDI3_9PSEU|nr:hypothetical protein [Actinophytocola algeriensis]MBB4906192.1 hypothetical protein [Actinophytocola algeriensis]MBE1472123.1 hypothetical protein [Actinophytocola algeriensis]